MRGQNTPINQTSMSALQQQATAERAVPFGTDVDSTIRRSILNWPNLYQNRSQVLHHLFCVLGNGYGWHDGQIIDKDQKPYAENRSEDADEIFAHLLQKHKEHVIPGQDLDAFITDRITKEANREAYLNHESRINIDQMSQQTAIITHTYPLSEGCLLCDIPDNVQTDWLDAAEEAANIILLSPNTLVEKSQPEFESGAARKNKNYAEQALQRIEQIRATRAKNT